MILPKERKKTSARVTIVFQRKRYRGPKALVLRFENSHSLNYKALAFAFLKRGTIQTGQKTEPCRVIRYPADSPRPM